MEGYRGHTGSNVQDFEGCCILHWSFLKGSCRLFMSCDSTDLGSRKLFCCGQIFKILYPGYVMGSRDLGSCRAVLPSDPVFWSRHVSDAHAVGTKRPEIQNSDSHFSSVTLCILLHLLSWENVSKALNPAACRVHSLRQVSQDGGDVKDCSRSNILFNQFWVLLRRIFFKRKKEKTEMKEKC